MKALLFLLSLAMMISSCSSTRKLKTYQKATSDSAVNKENSVIAVHTLDTSSVKKTSDSSTLKTDESTITHTTDGFTVINADSGSVVSGNVIVITDPHGKKKILVPFRDETKKETKKMEGTSTAKTEQKQQGLETDSLATQSKENTEVKKETVQTSKTVKRWSVPWWLWLLAAGALVFGIYKNKARIAKLFA